MLLAKNLCGLKQHLALLLLLFLLRLLLTPVCVAAAVRCLLPFLMSCEPRATWNWQRQAYTSELWQ
jgi:hypothetical protein